MKNILLSGLLVLLFCGIALAASIPKETALEAISTFEQAPLSVEGDKAAATIATFAAESNDVEIVISVELLPWLGADQTSPYYRQRTVLLAAYLAGNIKSQILKGKAIDDPYSGLLQVLDTYSQIKKTDGTIQIPEVEKIKSIKDNGELKSFVSHVVRANQ